MNKTVAQQVLNLKACIKNVSDVHDKQDKEGRLDTGECDVPYFCKSARTVDRGSLIKVGADRCNGCKIDDTVPACFLPDIRKSNYPPEPFGVCKEVEGLVNDMKIYKYLVHDTVLGGKNVKYDTCYNYP